MPEPFPHIGVLLHDFRLGGSERIAIRLAREWARLGRKVTVFAGEEVGPLRGLVGSAVSIVVRGGTQSQVRGDVRALARWAVGAVAAAGVGVIFLPGNSYSRAIRTLRRSGLPVVTKLSNPILRPDKPALRNAFFRLAMRRRWRGLSGLVICSEGEAAEIRGKVRPRVPITVIANPVLDALPTEAAAQKVPGQFCAIGRLVPQKNFPLLLEAFALLRDLPLTLRIGGDGELRHELEQLAMRLGVAERVEFLGTVPDVAALLAQSEALLLSSDFEGFPSVCVEALAAGTFVIARDAGAGVREILRMPRTGIIVTKPTPQAFAAAVRRYWQHRAFDAAAARVVTAGHVIAPIAAQYLRLLDTVR
jgi:glycosyltransferase involved in cell wall biosynthesis